MTRRWPAALLALLLSACAGVVGLFAAKEDQIKVPHAVHAKADVDCGSCHETIFDSTALDTRDMPTEKKCLGCHAKEKESGNCGFCHTNPEKPAATCCSPTCTWRPMRGRRRRCSNRAAPRSPTRR